MIARCAFLDGLGVSLSAEYGYELPSGAGANVDKAATILKHGGMELLGKVAKLTSPAPKKS